MGRPQREVSAVARVQKMVAKVGRAKIPATTGMTIGMAKERVPRGRANQVETIGINRHGRIVTTTRVKVKVKVKVKVRGNIETDANTYNGWRQMMCQYDVFFHDKESPGHVSIFPSASNRN